VPLWYDRAVSFTPIDSPRTIFFEVDEPMTKCTRAYVAGLNEARKNTAESRMLDEKDTDKSRVSRAKDLYWKKHTSTSKNMSYYIYHKKQQDGQNFSVWEQDIDAVIMGTHKTTKLPTVWLED